MTSARLVLSAAELAALAEIAAVTLPPGFADRVVPAAELTAARQALARRSLLEPGGIRPVPAVAANLALLAGPAVSVRVDAVVAGRGLRACFAVADQLGASLFALADGAAELSMFPATEVGAELVRAVPALTAAGGARLRSALDGESELPMSGRLPLAALTDYAELRQLDAAVEGLHLSAAERALADQLADHTCGTLRALVTARHGAAVAVGHVGWIATDRGWVGLRPEPDGTERRMVRLEPVTAGDLGSWLAPYVAEILEAADARA